jgi:hypothetical protein
MPLSPKMNWPYPKEFQDPWWDIFEAFVKAMDASVFTTREDKNLTFFGGGTFSFDAGTNNVSWTAPLVAQSAVTGFRWYVPDSSFGGSVTVNDGELLYVDLVRAPQAAQNIPAVAAQVISSDNALAIAQRIGSVLYFRNGILLLDGQSGPVFLQMPNFGYVRVSATDTTADYLGNKVQAGTGAALEVLNPGAVEALQVSAQGYALMSHTWGFDSAIADAMPTAQTFRLNNASPASATFIYIDSNSMEAFEANHWLSLIVIGDVLYVTQIHETSSPAKLAFQVTGGVLPGVGYYKIPVTLAWDAGVALTTGASQYVFGRERGVTGYDSDAFHASAVGEINALPNKAVPVQNDLVVLENSAASFAKVKTPLVNLSAVLGWSASQLLYVGKHGDNGNSGASPKQAFLTIGAAVGAAIGLTPSSSNRIAIVVLDAGSYSETISIPSWVYLCAPNATLVGQGSVALPCLTLAADSQAEFFEVDPQSTQGGVFGAATSGTKRFRARKVVATGSGGYGAVNSGASGGILYYTVEETRVGANAYGVGDGATSSGHVHLEGCGDFYLEGANAVAVSRTGAGTTVVDIGHVLETGAGVGTGTAFACGSGGSIFGTTKEISVTTVKTGSGTTVVSSMDNGLDMHGSPIHNARDWSGDNVAVPSGASATALPLSGSSTSLNLSAVLTSGLAAEYEIFVQHSPDAGGAAWTDIFVVTLSYDGTNYYFTTQSGQSGSDAGSAITLTGASLVTYDLFFDGSLTLDMNQDGTARHAQAEVWYRTSRGVHT